MKLTSIGLLKVLTGPATARVRPASGRRVAGPRADEPTANLARNEPISELVISI
jgi:hypothetical protein